MKYLFFIILFLSIGKNLYSQIDTIYFTSKWEVTKDTLYDYYITIDESNTDENYKTFFKSGEVKSSFSCSDMNLENFLQSKFHSTYKEYAKNGKIICQGLYENGLKTGLWSFFLENGVLDYEETYENGKLNGPYNSFFENGKVFQKGMFLNGNMNENWITKYRDGSLMSIVTYNHGLREPICHECNEYKKCKAIISNTFHDKAIQSDWFSSDTTYYVKDKSGLLVSFSKENSKNFYVDINSPWKNYDDFSFEVTFKNTNNSVLQYGISWNENEIEKTSNQFLISNLGTYTINNIEDNVYFENKFEKTNFINTDIDAENILKISRKGDKVYYSINGKIVESQKLLELEGSIFKIILIQDEKSINSSLIIKDFTFKDTELYDDVQNGLETGKFNWTGSGSGFFIDSSGFIATNYHVIETANEVWIKCYNNGENKKYKAVVSLSDKANDLAILKITDSTFVSLPPLPYKIATETLAVGNEIFTLGFPLADVIGETVKFTDGKVSSLSAVGNDLNQYQISAPIQSGNSGGPLFDNLGNVVGVVVSRLNKDKYGSENVNYAIKSLFLKNIIDMVPISLQNDKKKKNKYLSKVERIKIYSDYVVMIQTF